MPSNTSWNTEKELSFLKELASRGSLEFGTSRRGRNKVVDCERALAGYAAAFEARANWKNIDRKAVRDWLKQRIDTHPTEYTTQSQEAVLDTEYTVEPYRA